MKTCPNCGSKMNADVNFCTNCGTDIREVKLDSDVQAQAKQNADQTTSQATSADQITNSTEENNNQNQSSSNGNDFQSGINNFDVHNMWQWFVNSWKHPFSEQNASGWYGWITLLAEDILIGLGMYIVAQRAVGSVFGSEATGNTSNFSFGTAVELIFFLLLIEAAWIGSAYLAHKFIYNSNYGFVDFTTRIVQTSNLAAIFIVIAFLFAIISGANSAALIAMMLYASILAFGMALTVVVVGDPNPVHDKFYGYLLFIVLQIVTSAILGSLIFSIVLSQVRSYMPF